MILMPDATPNPHDEIEDVAQRGRLALVEPGVVAMTVRRGGILSALNVQELCHIERGRQNFLTVRPHLLADGINIRLTTLVCY